MIFGKYTIYILSAYGAAALLFIGLAFHTHRRMKAVKQQLEFEL